MATLQATKLQRKMINDIARSEFTTLNGGIPSCLEDIGWVWADVIIEDSRDKGVFTSLLNAGYAEHRGTGRNAVLTLTPLGFEAFQVSLEEKVTASERRTVKKLDLTDTERTSFRVTFSVNKFLVYIGQSDYPISTYTSKSLMKEDFALNEIRNAMFDGIAQEKYLAGYGD